MTIAVIGATGRVGRLVVEHLLYDRKRVRVLVRDPDKAHHLFDKAGGALDVQSLALDDRAALTPALESAGVVFIAMGSVGLEGNIQRVVLDAAAQSPSLEQIVRLSVLNAGPSSLGINQRAHWSLDFSAGVLDLPYTTIRPAIFSASVLAAAAEIRSARTWTGLADSGRVALSDHRDIAAVAARIVSDPTTWGTHYDLTGPGLVSWPDVVNLLSLALREPIQFRAVSEQTLIRRLLAAGVTPGQAELLVTREWAMLAGENERTTDTLTQLLGRAPRTVETFLHDHIDLFR